MVIFIVFESDCIFIIRANVFNKTKWTNTDKRNFRQKALVAISSRWDDGDDDDNKNNNSNNKILAGIKTGRFLKITKSVCSTDHMLSVSHALFVSHTDIVNWVTLPIICFNHRHYLAPFRIHIASNARHVFISTSSQILYDCCFFFSCMNIERSTTSTFPHTNTFTKRSKPFAKLNQEYYVPLKQHNAYSFSVW